MDADLEKRARELLAQHEQHDKTGGAPVVRRDDAIRAIAAALSAGQADARRWQFVRDHAPVIEEAGGFFRVIGLDVWQSTKDAAIDAAIAASGERDE